MLYRGFIDNDKLRADVLTQMFEEGLTFKAIAEDIGYSPRTVYTWMSGKRKPSVALATALIDRFNFKESEYNKL